MIGLSVLGGLAVYKIGGAVSDASPAAPPSVPWGDSLVSLVRKGVLNAPYNTTTVGQAFEATFTDCKWNSNTSAKGERFVEFTGRLKPEMYKDTFDSTVGAAYQSCLAAPPPENSIKAWYSAKAPREKIPPRGLGALPQPRANVVHDSNGDSCNVDVDPGGQTIDGYWRWSTPEQSAFYVITCRDRDGKPLDVANIATLPPEPKPSCGARPDEVAYSTVIFQFLFTADERSFRLGYFDPSPWYHVYAVGTKPDDVMGYIYK
jgi:hypothetical protein